MAVFISFTVIMYLINEIVGPKKLTSEQLERIARLKSEAPLDEHD